MRSIFILAIIIATFGCADEKSCKKALCTMEFAMVTMKLNDSTNISLSGISTQTILLSTGETIHSQSEANNFPAYSFKVADDSDIKELGFRNTQKVELRIFRDGKLLKNVPYTLKTDCCHVGKDEGPDEVSLN